MHTIAHLEKIAGLPMEQRLSPLGDLGCQVADGLDGGERPESALFDRLVADLLAAVESDMGEAHERVMVGEALGRLGDPRLCTPSDAGYWAELTVWDMKFKIGRYPVTNREFRSFIETGGYDERSFWDDAGWEWLQACEDPWSVLASREMAPRFTVANQPVVAVTWHEARAYARSHQARLPKFNERMWTVRGEAKRPYPWGEPFGHGNANTREEVLQRPCAVGLFRRDCTPEGVYDLAGNIAEWAENSVDEQIVIAPGAWSQSSMSSWAKARLLQPPECRGTDLGFRLARD